MVGAIFYHFNEELNWVDSFYFTTMTLATVGFGDLAPIHASSRLFTIIFSLVGIPAILFSLGIIVEDFIKQKIGHIEDEVNGVLDREEQILKAEEKILKEEQDIEKRMNQNK